MPGIASIEWDSEEDRARRRHHRKASTVHGWVTKMRGTFLGSESTRRLGLREMKEARAMRRYKKEHPEAFRNRNRSGGGGGTVLWIFPRRSRRHAHEDHHHRSHSHGHAHSHGHSHSHSHSHSRRRRHHDDYDDRHRQRHPWLHFHHHRVKSYHHGLGTYIAGILRGNRNMREKGRYLMRMAHKERRRERHKRRRQRRDEAHAMKLDRAAHGGTWWHR
ncbi:hypothetical protein BC628DRAFT_1419815 [Trametes gibbosa]|nr:hypothetical protein BC628DRAFT_1419815 [Trametes gibbosa]